MCDGVPAARKHLYSAVRPCTTTGRGHGDAVLRKDGLGSSATRVGGRAAS